MGTEKPHKKRRKIAVWRILLLLFLFTLLGGLSLALYASYHPASEENTALESATTGQEQPETPPRVMRTDLPDPKVPIEDLPDEPFEYPVTVMAVGDNLMHMGVVYTGRQDDGTYNYECLYESIADFLGLADIKIINQETVMAGNQLGFSGYPYFNSPVEVADGIAAAGFNVVLQASNHSCDQGIEGIDYCVSVWEKHPEVLMVGLHSGASDAISAEGELPQTTESENRADVTSASDQMSAREIPILEIDGVNFAILNYTYAPNSGYMPPEVQKRLEVLCNYNRKTGRMDYTTINPQVLEDIKQADEIADAVIVCPHWGTEYSTTASSYQKKFALQMTEAGADVIIGAHPHVVEPVEWITAENGNEALCFYSLGNYVSTQKDCISMLEAMAWVTFIVHEEGDTRTVTLSHTGSGAIPLVCQYSSSPVRIKGVFPLETYTEEQAAAHGIKSYGNGVLHLEELKKWCEEILGDAVLPVPY
ncbi:MAG: CapA family protein [Lachnospiraceae bacterium]|nr:CapA family protein [Lachnospiraceae bacterium]